MAITNQSNSNNVDPKALSVGEKLAPILNALMNNNTAESLAEPLQKFKEALKDLDVSINDLTTPKGHSLMYHAAEKENVELVKMLKGEDFKASLNEADKKAVAGNQTALNTLKEAGVSVGTRTEALNDSRSTSLQTTRGI
jgi:hypothetical protein